MTNDNIRILCLSCNVKKVGKLVRFKQKGQKQASFLAFHKCCQGCFLRGPRYISTSFILVCALRCTYLQVKYNIHLYSLRNKPEKLAKGSLFCLFLKLVQINFIFTDNVRILYMNTNLYENKSGHNEHHMISHCHIDVILDNIWL
jgi:hypothetical protein